MSILGIGTDIVAVERFTLWAEYPEHKLLRIFVREELADCMLSNSLYCSERLAVRFAAKEAFYKALSSALLALNCTKKSFSLLSICSLVHVIKEPVWQVPQLKVDWIAFNGIVGVQLSQLKVHLTLAHEQQAAVAFVIISL